MKRYLLAVFPAGAAAALYLWFFNNVAALPGGFFADRFWPLMVFGRLAGITGALGVMGQILVMSGAAWLEPLTGPGLPLKWHHRAGLAIPLALLVHPPLVVWHHALRSGNSFTAQYLSVLRWEDALPAAAGELMIVSAVVLSLPFLRMRMGYKAWRWTHLGVYAGLALSIGHQLALGGDLSAGKPYFAGVWYALLGFTAANTVWYRLIKKAA